MRRLQIHPGMLSYSIGTESLSENRREPQPEECIPIVSLRIALRPLRALR